jgi:hypothetical protein
MLNVRDTGQLPRNEEELDIVQRFAASCQLDIEDTVFEYPPQDAPLSWHLSPNDKKQIENIWTSQGTEQERQKVRDFIAATPAVTALPSTCGYR